jgi:hypothetical protein
MSHYFPENAAHTFLHIFYSTHNTTGCSDPGPRLACQGNHELTDGLRPLALAQEGVPYCCRTARLLYR